MSRRPKFDHVLLFAVLAIVLVGVVMITSIGVPKSISLSAPDLQYPDCSDDAVDCYLVLKKHVLRVVIGLVFMLGAFKMNFKHWKKLSVVIYGGGLALLLVLFALGKANNTFATSWLNFSSIPLIDSLQPSEIAKFGLVIYLSMIFGDKLSQEKIEDLKEGFGKFCLISGLIILPIALQPDIGSAMIVAFIGVSIYFLAGAHWKHLAIGACIALFAIVLSVSFIGRVEERFMSFFNPTAECGEGDCWQSKQANIAIGSGGPWGKGLTQGIQKSYWLPQATDDFVFAASAEELGFFRTVMLVLLYSTIAYRGYKIANHAPNKFAMLMAAGLTTWICVQAFVNIMVNTSLFPITGITLPFMSYGGSSMVTSLLAMGVLLNISKYTTENAYTFDRRGYSGTRVAQPRYSRTYSTRY